MSKEPPPTIDARTDETQPLLATSSDNLTVEDGGTPKPQPRNWKKVTYQIVLSLLSAGILAVFIKGFIDAGDVDFNLGKALKAALGGGLSGAAGMDRLFFRYMQADPPVLFSHDCPGVNANGTSFSGILTMYTVTLISRQPLRTVMNFQYRFGTTTSEAMHTLYADGGWARYYHGLAAALIQGPVARFGDTAANAGILALLQSNLYLKNLPALIKTIFASIAAAAFRMVLTPVDTVKTTMQTQGRKGLPILRQRIARYGIGTLWYGALATAAATFVGHYPWFGTYNYLEANLPEPHTLLQKLSRRAFIGFVSSVVSDSISNSLRVVKTYRQVSETRIGYLDAARAVIASDGVRGLMGRGLKTRILTNGLQGLIFSVLWKFFQDM
ncbi:hypothetical protein C0993_003174 [Termitomyces sp. T159_Od127]|nr:hypothetical protein C0993_003174 [Termitomyces sp. T159_Od127]